MRVTRWTHSCTSIQEEGRTLVIDPGIWSEPRALHGADAVLLTHEHADHVDVLRLRGLAAPVYAPAGADLPELEVVAVHPGERFDAAGFDVTAVGGVHAPVVTDQAPVANVGYLVEGGLYHPGDALHVPDQPVDTLLVPMQASWLKTAEAIDFVRLVGPSRAIGIHDGQINDRARASVNHWLAERGGAYYRWLAPGTTL